MCLCCIQFGGVLSFQAAAWNLINKLLGSPIVRQADKQTVRPYTLHIFQNYCSQLTRRRRNGTGDDSQRFAVFLLFSWFAFLCHCFWLELCEKIFSFPRDQRRTFYCQSIARTAGTSESQPGQKDDRPTADGRTEIASSLQLAGAPTLLARQKFCAVTRAGVWGDLSFRRATATAPGPTRDSGVRSPDYSSARLNQLADFDWRQP